MFRARRTILAVPGSSERFIAKSRSLPVDAIFLDLEDAVAPAAKAEARGQIVAALNSDEGWLAPTVTVRVNAWDTAWTTADVLEVVTGAGGRIDALVLPKVRSAHEVVALDMVLRQAEATAGLPVGRIGIEAQIEEAQGLSHVEGSLRPAHGWRPRPRAGRLHGVHGDARAVGRQPDRRHRPDAFHYVLMRILAAARANGLQAIDGP